MQVNETHVPSPTAEKQIQGFHHLFATQGTNSSADPMTRFEQSAGGKIADCFSHDGAADAQAIG
jgi:hypothetical protein